MKQYLFLLLICMSNQFFAQQSTNHLSATIIGSGSPIYNKDRAGSSVLITYKDTKILVDMGNGAQANLDKNSTKIRTLDALLFTHHHLDHNEEFVPIFIQSLLGGNEFIIAGPEPTNAMIDNTLNLYKEDISYRLSKSGRTLDDVKKKFSSKTLLGNESFYIGEIKVSCTEVKHTITTLAYRFDVGDESIVISGDLSYSASLPILAKDADYLILDSGGAIEAGAKATSNKKKKSSTKTEKAHVNLDESSRMAQEANAKTIVLTHFTFTNINEEATTTEIKKNYSGRVLYAKDLMTLPVQAIANEPKSSTLKYTYPIVDTDIQTCYSDMDIISAPSEGDAFYGQDANYQGNQASYTNNGDGTITDNVTGLVWEANMGTKMTYDEAFAKAAASTLGDHSDWRVPSIKELYSLILFTGQVKGAKAIDMFINTDYFDQPLGEASKGEREIDAQTWSSTQYVGRTMRSDETVFGVNFVDGRIKGYPKYNPKSKNANTMYFRMVRGNTEYGTNNFIDNHDGTVSDLATGLMWQKADDGKGKDWEEALSYAENLELAQLSDWRLPNAKELSSIVDYSRSPQTTNSPAIDPIFETTEIKDPQGNAGQYPFYWTGTTHLDGKNPYASAAYFSFGEGQGEMRETLMDVHGAGCQRSDPKSGNIDDYPQFFGPQGDVRYVYNYVRAVRYINIEELNNKPVYSEVKEKPVRTTQKKNSANARQNKNSNKNTPPSFQELLEKMDTDKDNRLSESEVKGKLKEHFDQRDSNGDGYITENEMTRK